MDTVLNALQSVALRPQRADGSAPASERQDERKTRSSEGQQLSRPVVEAPEVEQAVSRLNKALEALNRDLAISVHEDEGKLIIQVTDPSTGEVVRQIPPERVLEVEESIDNIVGLFVNDSA